MRTHKNKIFTIILSLSLLLPVVASAQTQGPIDPAFNPNLLIPDSAFSDAGTFGSASAIQTFLLEKGSVLANTSPSFVAMLKEPDVGTKTGLEDPEPNLAQPRTAAQLIYDAATHFGLNPQVILVMLQKEQSLITGTFSSNSDLQSALDHAVGFACPDNQPCGDIFESFYRQLFGSFDPEGNRWLGAAASLMRSFSTPGGRGPMVDAQNETFGNPTIRTSAEGDSIILDNTQGGYDGVLPTQTVTLGNLATAALYRYTPHVFNGNYNFWKFYTLWFKYPNGTVVEKIGDTAQYVIDNGTVRTFSTYVAAQRKLNLGSIIPVSQTEFDSYNLEPPLPPIDGTLIKGDADPTVYLIQNEEKEPISGPIFTQQKFSFKKIVTLPQAEVDAYQTGPFVAPNEGTLIVGTSDPTVYIVAGGQKDAVDGPIFQIRKFSFKKVLRLSDDEVAALPTGPIETPPDKTAIKTADDPTIYWFANDLKQPVSAFVYKQRGIVNFPLLVLPDGDLQSFPSGAPLPPKDGTVIKGDQSDAIYIIQNGLKDLLTPTSYKRLGYPKPTVLPQAEVNMYNPGDDITN